MLINVDGKINANFKVDKDGKLLLLNMSNRKTGKTEITETEEKWFTPVEIQFTGFNQDDHHGNKYTGTSPGHNLKYRLHRDYENEKGRKLEFVLEYNDIEVVQHYQFYKELSVVTAYSEVYTENEYDLEYLSSFNLVGISKNSNGVFDRSVYLHIPHNTWHGECQWRRNPLGELGLSKVNDFSLKRLSYDSVGTWSSCGYLPMGCIEVSDTGEYIFWQIEHNGSWHFEISDIAENLYLSLSGPTYNESHFLKKLRKNSFRSVPATVAFADSFEECISEMTKYRRSIRRKNNDNLNNSVIFNDYMNCLMGDPTADKLYPLIDAAKAAGCDYFCIDAGWFSEEMGSESSWWSSVGEWIPSKSRFPDGIEKVIGYIKSKDMIPGLWLELEVMGIDCPLAKIWEDDCFFVRNGKRVIDHGRYQLDYRNEKVRKYAYSVIDRLVNGYGCGYIKMDYNINAGVGTELDADSPGDGLLKHNRAYTEWLKSVFEKYPDLIIENCGSGGMRMDYALLAQYSIQSVSDQTDYKLFPETVSRAASAVTPEQSAIWSYPMAGSDKEETVFNMVNAMTQRIHQSGHLANINDKCFGLIKQGIAVYKTYNKEISDSLPYWPNGFPRYGDRWLSYGLKMKGKAIVAVWKLDSEDDVFDINLGDYENAKCIYPSNDCFYSVENNILSLKLEGQYKARLFEFT